MFLAVEDEELGCIMGGGREVTRVSSEFLSLCRLAVSPPPPPRDIDDSDISDRAPGSRLEWVVTPHKNTVVDSKIG